MSKPSSRLKTFLGFALSLIIGVGAFWMFFNRQFVLDQYTVWTFEPTSSVAAISDRVAFTRDGEFAFYATTPALASQDEFNEGCPRHEPGSPILGCYTSADRIFIYDVPDDSLDGIEEVTAVHEMLHAVWARMDARERADIEDKLVDAYKQVADDSLQTRMEYYERNEPGELTNELHSILGTEVRDLGDELEAYYNQYFDRTTVLDLYDSYNSVYTALYERSDELYTQLNSLAQTIESSSARYATDAAQLSKDIESFNQRADAGSFTTQAQFNQERAALMRRQEELEAERTAINTSIETYNAYYTEYQQIAAQIQTLSDTLDSYKEIDETPTNV